MARITLFGAGQLATIGLEKFETREKLFAKEILDTFWQQGFGCIGEVRHHSARPAEEDCGALGGSAPHVPGSRPTHGAPRTGASESGEVLAAASAGLVPEGAEGEEGQIVQEVGAGQGGPAVWSASAKPSYGAIERQPVRLSPGDAGYPSSLAVATEVGDPEPSQQLAKGASPEETKTASTFETQKQIPIEDLYSATWAAGAALQSLGAAPREFQLDLQGAIHPEVAAGPTPDSADATIALKSALGGTLGDVWEDQTWAKYYSVPKAKKKANTLKELKKVPDFPDLQKKTQEYFIGDPEEEPFNLAPEIAEVCALLAQAELKGSNYSNEQAEEELAKKEKLLACLCATLNVVEVRQWV